MRIAIDARELVGQPTGVGRYLTELLAAWSELPGAAAHEFVLCAPAGVDVPRAAGLRLSSRTAPGGGTLWEQRALPRLVTHVQADLLFAPAYTGPIFCRIPVVVTIHDVSFAAHPEWFGWREGLRRRWLTRLTARRAARVLTVSSFSKREIVRHLGVDAHKVHVIYSGATVLAGPTAAPEPQEAPLVLYVGSLFNRRHVPELIDGFARMARRRPGARLEIVGDNRTKPRVDVSACIAQAGAERVRARSYVPDEELAALYSRAAAFAFLSDYEGFGMTPLEALAAGVPIVVLDTEVAREIYGPAALYVARPDPVLIEAALERVLFDEHERARLREAAREIVARYSWRECAQRTLQLLLAAGG